MPAYTFVKRITFLAEAVLQLGREIKTVAYFPVIAARHDAEATTGFRSTGNWYEPFQYGFRKDEEK
jgi:hypothetical protein